LPLQVFAGGKKDTNNSVSVSSPETAPSTIESEFEHQTETQNSISDDRIIPDAGLQPVLENELSEQDDAELTLQENSEEIPAEENIELTQEEAAAAETLKVTEMDIRTSTLLELAEWCRSLGLSEGGSKQELDLRLREHYGIGAEEKTIPLANGETGEQKTIIIESARSTEYFTLEVVNEDYARLEGNVIVSLKDEDAVHRIQAWEIVYNRTRNTMTAKGNVEYKKESGDSIETFKGDSLTINLDTFAGIFTGGASERSTANSGSSEDEQSTAYRFEGNVISRSEDGVTILQDAIVTNGKNEENYWSIKASKIWLLPGSDFAIFNAILKVGEIPILYIPFFFLPADEIIFHPVIGTRTREGYFFQTTTYILGRPKASETEEKSTTSIFGNSSDMEKTRNGLFLRSTGQKSRDPNDTRLSILFDAYANLGLYLGTELELPDLGILDNLNLSFGLGFTRDIYEFSPEWYTPFAPDFNGESNWNWSKLFAEEIP
jgi:lipopolysaccharide assembly outer membrane protein LptD (OstA)